MTHHPPTPRVLDETSAARSRDESAHDLALARRASRGDESAFADLYRRHHQRVYRHCLRLLRSPEDAADATQQTFINMHGMFAKGAAPESHLGAYVLQVARRACYEVHHRRAAQWHLTELSQHYMTDASSVADHAPSVINSAAIREAADALPDRHRQVLVMREVRDMSYDEIGDDLGMSPNAVAQLLHRARRRLAGELIAHSVIDDDTAKAA